jgi:RNase P/RNase MRP subunit p29
MASSQKVSRSDKLSFKAQCAIIKRNFIGTKIAFMIRDKLFSGLVVWETKRTFHILLKDVSGMKAVKVIKKAGTSFEIKCPKELISVGLGSTIKVDGKNLLGTSIERISRCA